jgi:hypothetical protein
MKPFSKIVPVLLSSLLVLASSLALHAATTYSLAGDWNASSDSASNLWAYGTFTADPGLPATFYVPTDINYNTTDVPGLGIWFFANTGPGADGSDPNIEKNVTGSDVGGAPSPDWLAGEVSFGPFLGPAVAQFTVPTTGLYDISARFQTDEVNTLPTAYVYIGALNVFDQPLSDPGNAEFGTAAPFAMNDVALIAGETVDFEVGNGLSTTQVDAELTLVPEPSICAMVGLGALVLVWRFRRKATHLG